MLFVVLANVKAGTSKERIARRAQWRLPEGVRLVAEYWLQSENPGVIDIIETDRVAPIMAGIADWDDVYEFTVVPAITAQEGLELAKQMMQK
jgi:hypothetical protein